MADQQLRNTYWWGTCIDCHWQMPGGWQLTKEVQSGPFLPNRTCRLLRHGCSLANEAGIVVSSRDNGVLQRWRLADAGRQHAIAAGKELASQLSDSERASLLIVASPFSRTVDTAELVAAQVGITPGQEGAWQLDDRLVERSFGSANELQPHDDVYEAAWALDAHDLHARPGGDGESVAMVVARLQGLFAELEAQHSGRCILLVAHGDTLSICQAAMTQGGHTPQEHRQFGFRTAELRRLNS